MFQLTTKQIQALSLLKSKTMNILLCGGARSGKTFVILFYILIRALKYPKSRSLIARFHLADLKGSIINDSLLPLLECLSPDFYHFGKSHLNRQDWYIEFPNAAQIWFSGLGNDEQVEKALGREYSLIYINEATQITYEVFDKIKTRLSQNIQGLSLKLLVDCNPTTINSWIHKLFIANIDPFDGEKKNKIHYAHLLLNPIDNEHLPEGYINNVLKQLSYRQRQRFLHGIWLEEVQGALWSIAMIDPYRQSIVDRNFYKEVVIGVDPAISSNKNSNETGIVVVASKDGEGYVLEDASAKYSPNEWAMKVSQLYKKWQANFVVAEINQGGQMVVDTLRHVDRSLCIRKVRAATGKLARAEPIAALYEQGIIHHCGYFNELESQMTTFVHSDKLSPDRLDALVWAFYKLFIDKLNFYIINANGVISV